MVHDLSSNWSGVVRNNIQKDYTCTSGFWWVLVAQSLVFCVVFCRLFCPCWLTHCLSFDLYLLITAVASLIVSYCTLKRDRHEHIQMIKAKVLVNITNTGLELEAEWAEPVSLTFHSAMRNLIQNLPQVLPTKFRFI